MKLRSPIFAALAAIYEESQAGRTGRGTKDVQPTYAELERRFRQLFHRGLEGEEYDLALQELRTCDRKILQLEWDHPRARSTVHKIRLPVAREAAFYAALGRESPTQLRQRWSDLFLTAASRPVPPAFAAEWRRFCASRAACAERWEKMEPFRLRKLREGAILLATTKLLLGWRGENLIRWVSSALCGDSKHLEHRQRSLELLLREASGSRIASFETHGILPMPREARVSGPLKLRIAGRFLDCEAQEVSTLSIADLKGAEFLNCAARRCLTVENKTVFLDLAHKRSGELIVWTSFPNAATLALLALLPPSLEFWHFGDTDPSGFHILQDLCRRSERHFRPFRMQVRSHSDARSLTASERALVASLTSSPQLLESREELDKMLAAGKVGAFEQEEHQPAPLNRWPFY